MKRNTILKSIAYLCLPVLLLSSCATKNPGTSSIETISVVSTVSEALKETDMYKLYDTDELPATDLGGYTFKIATCMPDTIKPKAGQTDMLDAILARTEAIEKRFNCKIEVIEVPYGQMVATLQPKILAGDKVANVIMTNVWEVGGFITSKTIANLATVPNIKLDKPWWNESMSKISKINGKTLVAVPYLHSPVDNSYVMFYNKKLAEEIGMGDVYQLVEDKQWTIEKFREFAKMANKDLDGDGKMTLKDRWGWSGPSYDSYNGFVSSSNITLIDKDETGKPYFALNTPSNISKLQTINDIFVNDSIYHPEQVFENQQDLFRNNKVLFYSYALLGGLQYFREMDNDFGVVPFPLGEGETNYKNRVDHNNLCAVIPLTNTELDKTGLILEALAFSSWKATPDKLNFYKNLYLRDEQSGVILDQLPNYATFDMSQLAYTSNFLQNIGALFQTACFNPSADIATTVATIEPVATTDINDFFGSK